MPVRVTQTVQGRDRQERHRLPRWLLCQRFLATACSWLRSLSPRTPRMAPERRVGGWAGAQARGGDLPRQTPGRGWCLVAPGSLSLIGPCRDAGCVAASILSCLGRPSQQAPLAGALCFERASRQAPLAGALLSSGGLPGKLLLPGPWLKYFVLGWPKKGPWRVLAVAWQALLRGATTARAQVRGTKVPLL